MWSTRLAHFSLSALYVCAISGTRGSSGLGSHNREQMESRTAETGTTLTSSHTSFLHIFLHSVVSFYLKWGKISNEGAITREIKAHLSIR